MIAQANIACEEEGGRDHEIAVELRSEYRLRRFLLNLAKLRVEGESNALLGTDKADTDRRYGLNVRSFVAHVAACDALHLTDATTRNRDQCIRQPKKGLCFGYLGRRRPADNPAAREANIPCPLCV